MLVVEVSERLEVGHERLWALISDVRRLREFAAWEIASSKATNVCDLGLEFRWHERGVLLGKRYECDCKVFGWEPPTWVCFGTKNLFHVSYELEPSGSGTTLELRVEWPHVPKARRDEYAELCRKTMKNLKLLVERP